MGPPGRVAAQRWALRHREWNRLQHILHGNTARGDGALVPAGGEADAEDLDGEEFGQVDFWELAVTLGGMPFQMPLATLRTDDLE